MGGINNPFQYLLHEKYSHTCLYCYILVWLWHNFHHNQQYCHYNKGFQKLLYLLTFLRWISFVNSIFIVCHFLSSYNLDKLYRKVAILFHCFASITFPSLQLQLQNVIKHNAYFKVCWKWHCGGNVYDILEKWCMSFLRESLHVPNLPITEEIHNVNRASF